MKTSWIATLFQIAVVFAGRSTSDEPRLVEVHEIPAFHAYNSAVSIEASNPHGALDFYRRALEIKPDLEDALLNIGSLYDRIGDIESAMLSYERLLNLPSTSGHFRASACNNIGHLRHKIAGKDVLNLKESVDWYERALTYDESHVDSRYNLGKVLQDLGEDEKAKEVYLALLEIDPGHPEARLNLSNYFFKLQDYYNAAVHQKMVGYSEKASTATRLGALNNLGHLYRDSNNHDQAEQSFMDAFILSGNTSSYSLTNLYIARRTLNKWEGAEDLIDEILRLGGEVMEQRTILRQGNVLKTNVQKVRLSEEQLATSHLATGTHELLRIKRDSPESNATILTHHPNLCCASLRFASLRFASLRSSQQSLQSPPLMPYDSLLLSATSPSHRLLIASMACAPYESVQRLNKLNEDLAVSNKITVSYLSYDFRDHPMGHLTRALVLGHDKDGFRTVLLSYGVNDGSIHRRSFETADRFIEANVPLPGGGTSVNPLNSARQLHLEDVDIAVDLMSHTRGAIALIAALKPASILVNYLGFPGTSGGAHYDYAVVDKVVAPPEAATAAWSEKLIVLPHTYQANEYDVSAGLCDGGSGEFCKRARKLLKGDTAHFAVCNFNNIDKVTTTSFDVWMNILRSNSNAKLYMLRPKDPAGSVIVDNLILEAAARGVERSRVVFMERAEHKDHVDRIGGCDAMVDTLVYGAHTTASDFLWAGVPIFNMHGYGAEGLGGGMSGGMASRVASSFLSNLIKSEGHRSVKALEEEVHRLLASPEGTHVLGAMRKNIAKSLLWRPHFDNKLITKNIEKGYEIAVELRKAGLENMNIVINPHTSENDSLGLYAQASSLATKALDEAMREGKDSEHYQTALKITERLVVSFGDETGDVHHLRGLAYQGIDMQSAIRHVRKAVEMSHEDVSFRYNLGSLLSQIGEGEGAMREYIKVLRLDFEAHMMKDLGKLVISLPTVDKQQAFDNVCGVNEIMTDLCGLVNGNTDLEGVKIGGLTDEMRTSISRFFLRRAQQVFDTRKLHASRLLQVAVKINPEDGRVRLKLGAAREDLGDGEGAWRESVRAVNSIHAVERSPSPFKPPSGRPVVAIYCNEYGQTWWPHWSYSSHKRGGLGGSEESALFLAREVANMGYTVVIYNDIIEEEEGKDPENDHVYWTHWKKYNLDDPPDIFVAWRYHLSLAVAGVGENRERKPRKTFLWLQDAVSTVGYTREMCEAIDNIFVLSTFHSRILPSYCSHKVTPNGIDVGNYFMSGGDGDGTNDSGVMSYGSAPNRGLELLLSVWGKIHRRLVEGGTFGEGGPTLNVYYGFSSSFMKFGRSGQMGITEQEFEAWVGAVKEKMKSLPGVNYVGMVPHDKLTREYAASGFILYPTKYPETGCVTLMKAMSAGAIPVTSRYRDSTLPELTGDYDLGPEGGLWDDMTDEEMIEWRRQYVDKVVEAVERGRRGELHQMRSEMKESSRARFSWRGVATLWVEEFA